MALFAAGRVITPGYRGPRLCYGCNRTDATVLFDLDLIGPLNPDLCLDCLVQIEKDVKTWMQAHLAAEVAEIQQDLTIVRGSRAVH